MNIKRITLLLLLIALPASFVPITASSAVDNVSDAISFANSANNHNILTESLIGNGDFSDPVTIKDVLTNNQTESDAGWYAKFSADSKTLIFQISEDENTFLRVTDVTSGQRGVYFNSGVILQPGRYVLKADLRISESAESGGMWRDVDKSTMQMRVNLQDAENPNSPQYALNNSVDKDTTYSKDGNVIGTLTDIGRDWTPYTDTITVDEPVLAVFKIGGGVSGAVDAHGFDIDNISLVPIVQGDANKDDKVSPLDAVYILRYLADWDDYGDENVNIFAIDLDGDGKTTMTDAKILCRHLAKWIGYESLLFFNGFFKE